MLTCHTQVNICPKGGLFSRLLCASVYSFKFPVHTYHAKYYNIKVCKKDGSEKKKYYLSLADIKKV